jgi:ubiquinone biosynthesis protein
MISIGKIGVMGRTYRHAKRYQEILHVLIKYGFGDLVDALNIKEHIDIVIEKVSGHEPERLDKLSRPERVRMTLEELGPTFVKLGQILSTRADLIPLDYVQELSKLQGNVPPFPMMTSERSSGLRRAGSRNPSFTPSSTSPLLRPLSGKSIGRF